jgi:transcriptional antiterminator NusG
LSRIDAPESVMLPLANGSGDAAPRVGGEEGKWHVLWTRSHCEEKVCDQLVAKGFHPFLPLIAVWSRRHRMQRRIPVPMFPGYLFLRHPIDKESYFDALGARGLVRFLGGGWGRLATVPDREIDAIKRLLDARIEALHHPFLREGQRVRITRGPLAGVEGLLVQFKTNKGLLVLSVDLLRRSVAVEVDCTLVVPA